MRRFFRSAAFPILIVIVLAFFAQRLISPSDSEDPPTYSEFVKQVDTQPSSIESVSIDTKTNTVEVTENDDNQYSTGYPPNTEESLVNALRVNRVKTEVKGTGGSSLLSILTYILPFVLFFG